jgi:hypothetical protein
MARGYAYPAAIAFFGSTPVFVETGFSERVGDGELQLSSDKVDHRRKTFKRVKPSGLSLGRLNHGVNSFTNGVGEAAGVSRESCK